MNKTIQVVILGVLLSGVLRVLLRVILGMVLGMIIGVVLGMVLRKVIRKVLGVVQMTKVGVGPGTIDVSMGGMTVVLAGVLGVILWCYKE